MTETFYPQKCDQESYKSTNSRPIWLYQEIATQSVYDEAAQQFNRMSRLIILIWMGAGKNWRPTGPRIGAAIGSIQVTIPSLGHQILIRTKVIQSL